MTDFAFQTGGRFSEPPTPDFYSYRWAAPKRVEHSTDSVTITWDDGVELVAYGLWLRENAVGAGGVDPATREALIDPADLPQSDCIAHARIDEHGTVMVRFEPDAHDRADDEVSFHPGWLRHIADRLHLPASWMPQRVAWTAETFSEPPTHDGARALDDEAAFGAFVDDLVRYGVARFRGCSTDPDLGHTLASRLGALRLTNFGDVWDVKALAHHDGASDRNSTANTNLRLGPHTDLPTRETPPGFQFLHCIVNEATGGWSTMTDGAAVVDHLARHHPDDYEALTTLRWVFFNRGKGIDHRWTGPLVDLGVPGSPLTIRAFYPVRAFPAMDQADVARAYKAMKHFSRLADDARFVMSFPFKPGDVVGFDNRRVLHGRQAFETGGARHLRGFYIDHDEVHSYARVANRVRAVDTN